MIQSGTFLNVVDNSGAKIAKCIKVLGGFQRRYANIGNIVVVAIQKIRSKNKAKSKVKKGEVLRAIIIRTKFKKQKKDGSNFMFAINAGVLINKQNKPIATRILGPVTKDLKTNKFMKVASLSAGFL
jgi:large subunit ribosomal protein L14